jgi:hypothetical protein
MAKRATRVELEVVPPTKPQCEYCGKEFQLERTLMNHTCEKKRRWLWKDEKYAMLGFRAYQRFYEKSLRSKTPKSVQDFIDSRYYLGFTKFGKFIQDINAVDPMGFVDFLIKAEVKLDDWCTAPPYESFTREMAKKETFERALERSILLMEQWARDEGDGAVWTDFFRKVSPGVATKWIRSGRVSPWLLYTVGDDLLDRMSNEQMMLIKEWIDPGFWPAKLQLHKEEVKLIVSTLREAGV